MQVTLLIALHQLLPNTNHLNTKPRMKIRDGNGVKTFGIYQKEEILSKKNVTKIHCRYDAVQKGPEAFTTSGLNSLKYYIKEIKQTVAFTSISVDFVPEEVNIFSTFY